MPTDICSNWKNSAYQKGYDEFTGDLFSEFTSLAMTLKDINDLQCRAAVLFKKRIDRVGGLTPRLNTAREAQRKLGELGTMASNLQKAYQSNAASLNEEAATSDDLVKTNLWLSWCYFMIGLSKVMDVIAQFYGGGFVRLIGEVKAKFVTDIKTPLTDLGKEPASSKPNFALTTQAANATVMVAKELPGGKDLEEVGLGIQAVIESIKDMADLLQLPKDLSGLAANFKLQVSRGAASAAKLLDLVKRLITLYETDSLASRFPGLPDLPGCISPIKTFLSAAKYTIEAISNFYDCCRSLSDAAESYTAAGAARDLASRQVTSTGGGGFVPDVHLFAQATKRDLIRIIHAANSAPDAGKMSQIALSKMRELGAEIDRMTDESDREDRGREDIMIGIDMLKRDLRTVDERLQRLREKLTVDRLPWDGRPVDEKLKRYRKQVRAGGNPMTNEGVDFVLMIDAARGDIARALTPGSPGRFGPRYSTQ